MRVVINTSKDQGSTAARRVYSLAIIAFALCSSSFAVAQDAPTPAASMPAASTSAAASPEAGSASGSNSEAQEMLYYVCGQAGFEKTVTSPDPRHPFNLGITFVAQQNGAPLSDVAVRLRRHGRVLMDFVAGGPRCLFSVPSASYRIEGTYHGEMKFEIVETGTFDTQIKW